MIATLKINEPRSGDFYLAPEDSLHALERWQHTKHSGRFLKTFWDVVLTESLVVRDGALHVVLSRPCQALHASLHVQACAFTAPF